jgi:hypothetical protein
LALTLGRRGAQLQVQALVQKLVDGASSLVQGKDLDRDSIHSYRETEN